MHAVLDPGAHEQQVLVERTLSGAVNIREEPAVRRRRIPINTGGGIPISGAEVTIIADRTACSRGRRGARHGQPSSYASGRYLCRVRHRAPRSASPPLGAASRYAAARAHARRAHVVTRRPRSSPTSAPRLSGRVSPVQPRPRLAAPHMARASAARAATCCASSRRSAPSSCSPTPAHHAQGRSAELLRLEPRARVHPGLPAARVGRRGRLELLRLLSLAERSLHRVGHHQQARGWHRAVRLGGEHQLAHARRRAGPARARVRGHSGTSPSRRARSPTCCACTWRPRASRRRSADGITRNRTAAYWRG